MDLIGRLSMLDAVDVIRLTFVSAAASVLLVYFIPALQTRLLDYGARSDITGKPVGKIEGTGVLSTILDHVASYKVPHSWFESFYLLSVSLSLLWLIVLPVSRSTIPFSTFVNVNRSSVPFSRTQLGCILMLVQGMRRYMECKQNKSNSDSTMWIGHWVVGLGFYTGMSVAIWIEGTPSLIRHKFSVHDVEITAPSIRSASSVLLFILASGIQHDCHAYLASLRRRKTKDKTDYQLPSFPAFSLTLTPHYFMECLIYLALAILTAPDGHWLNGTISCALLFVITNLGATAIGTRRWYERKFGAEAVAGKAAMVPFLF